MGGRPESGLNDRGVVSNARSEEIKDLLDNKMSITTVVGECHTITDIRAIGVGGRVVKNNWFKMYSRRVLTV